jgi:hypothetical protein
MARTGSTSAVSFPNTTPEEEEHPFQSPSPTHPQAGDTRARVRPGGKSAHSLIVALEDRGAVLLDW